MTFTHFMGTNLSSFHNDMQNYENHSMPWVFDHFSHGMPEISLHFPSSVNPSFGSRGTMPPYSPFSFCGIHIPQTNLTLGGWNIPSYESTFPGASAQMVGHYTYCTLSTYPSSIILVATNYFPIAELRMSSGVSSRGS
jgi:hypothetical protein